MTAAVIVFGLIFMLVTGFVAGVMCEQYAAREASRERSTRENQYFIHPRHNRNYHCDRSSK